MHRRMQGVLLVAATLSAPTHAQPPQDTGREAAPPQRLTRDSVIARHGVTGERHEYTVEADAGSLVDISVSQAHAQVEIALLGPDGAAAVAIDLPSLDPLPERLMFVTARAGDHRIVVRLTTRDVEVNDHQYELRVLAVHPASEADGRRVGCFGMGVRADRLARTKLNLSGLAEVIDLLKQATACWTAESDVAMQMATLASTAGLAGLFSDYRLDSAAALEQLIPMLRAAGRTDLELQGLDDLLVEYNDDGRFDRARDTAIAMQRLAASLKDRPKEGRAFQRLGFAEFSLGNYESSRRAALAALDIARELDDVSLLATAQLMLGRIEDVAGDYEAALARYEQGLNANPPDRFAVSALTNALGFLQLRRGEYSEASRQFEARLAMVPRYVQRDSEALARVGLGDVHLARGEREAAGKMFAAAAETLRRGMPSIRCIAIQRLGRLALQEGRLEEAAAHFNEMLALNQQMGNPPCEAEAQAGIADVALQRGDLETADSAARHVIQIAEQFREAVPNLESRALGFGALAPAFTRAVEISMRRAERGDAGAAGRALVMNERALARGLLDHLSAAAIDDAPLPSERLAIERQRVREQWRVRVAQFQVAAHTSGDRDRSERLRQEMTALDLQLRDLEARGDDDDARRARLVRPQVLEVDAMQALLDQETILVEYALGDRQSYVWVVSSGDMRAFPLAPRVEIEAAARAVYSDLTTAASAVQTAAEERRRALSRLVLAPVASRLTGRRLVIVSAGALSLVPFGALPFEDGSGGGPTLLSRFEVVHVPSATTLAAMRALTERRARPRRHTVVFADPIFEAADPRTSTRGGARPVPRQNTPRSAQPPRSSEGVAARTLSPLGSSFPRLPFSRTEANALHALLPGQVTLFVDGLATRDRALGRALDDYRFIHFATHGVVHPEVPSLSSIVLSFVDGTGVRHDPFLTLPDIYDMRVNADLVVLSACSTAEGRHVPGEGPIGLARAFMYAGAPRVVASLWRVNDSATAELMKRFYQGMLVEGLPAAAALRTAQQQVAGMPRWASPYYWAPFVLQGDWR